MISNTRVLPEGQAITLEMLENFAKKRFGMKYAFLLTGGNAAGKTTTVEKALAPWSYLTAKNGWWTDPRIDNIRADNDSRFKGESYQQEAALTSIWLSNTPVIVIEGTRINTPLMRVAKKLPDERKFTVLMALQKPDVMKAHLIKRCAKRNKQFRSEYWTYQKLEYEGMKRYPNSFYKHGITPVRFQIDLEYNVCQEIVDHLQNAIRLALNPEED